MRSVAFFVALVTCACGNVTTKDPDNNQAPVAVAPASVNGITNVPITFDGSGSSDPDGFIVAFDWDYGDGNTGSGEQATHTYASEGSYEVTLRVRDDGQKEAVASTTAVVGDLSVIAGPWELVPDVGFQSCDNPHQSYSLLFPAPTLTVSVNGTVINAQTELGVTLTGGFDAGGELRLDGTTNDAAASCGVGNPAGRTTDERVLAQLSTASELTGQYVIQVTANDPFCNCSKIFQVTGSQN